MQKETTEMVKPAVPETPPAAAPAPAAPVAGGTEGLSYVLSVLEQVKKSGATGPAMGTTPEEQIVALQVSTALSLLTAGANMLLMYSGALGQTPGLEPTVAAPAAVVPEAPAQAAAPQAAPAPAKPVESANIIIPSAFSVPPETMNMSIREVIIGGSGTRTSAVKLGGASALPFRHFEGNTGHAPVVGMEVFDKLPRNYPDAVREAYGDVVNNPAEMARYCVDKLGAKIISVRLDGCHPDNGDKSSREASAVVGDVLKAVGVPVIVTGPSHYEKANEVMKEIASTFAGENLLLNWVETDNYKTIAAAAMGYGHSVVTQTPIDVNMAKQLNILVTNMGLAPEKIVIDALTGAIGYGLEYTYSVMERIRTAAFTGDPMLAMPILATPGFEVAKTKESKAPSISFPLWGDEKERGALLEIATAMSLLNAGADLIITYHPVAARTVTQKIAEMTRTEGKE